MTYKIDFNAINQVALQDIRTLLARWLPGGQYRASEYVVRNPTRHDNSPGSFSINIQTGKWNDFATGDCGNGLISLYQYISSMASAYEAAKLLDQELHGQHFSFSAACAPKSPKAPKVSGQNANEKYAVEIWEASEDASGTLVDSYLKSRGIVLDVPASLRFHPHLFHSNTNQRYPAMVGGIMKWPDNKVVAIHRTYLALDGKGKADIPSNKRMLSSVEGGAIRFGKDLEVIAIAEGIETALTIYQSTGITTWAALSASGFKNLILPSPDIAKEIIIAADNDTAGQTAAFDAADRWTREGRKVKVIFPSKGKDFNDLLQQVSL